VARTGQRNMPGFTVSGNKRESRSQQGASMQRDSVTLDSVKSFEHARLST